MYEKIKENLKNIKHFETLITEVKLFNKKAMNFMTFLFNKMIECFLLI